MWVCIVLNIIIILCLLLENRSLRTSIVFWQKGYEEDVEEIRHSGEKMAELLQYSKEEIQNELGKMKENEENAFEAVSVQIKELENFFGEFGIVKDVLEEIKESCVKIGEADGKHYLETKEAINIMNERYNFLQKNWDVIEELFRLQLVNSLIDDADSARKLYEETHKGNGKHHN